MSDASASVDPSTISSSHSAAPADHGTSHINLSLRERWASLFAGSALMMYGLSHRNWSGILLAGGGGMSLYWGVTGHCPLYDAMGVNRANVSGTKNMTVPHHQGVLVEKLVTINRPQEELYRFWRNLENLPRFMHHLESVSVDGDGRSHWKVKGPAGLSVEWNAEIINEHENELIAWRSLDGAAIDHAGSVRFKPAPGGRGTEVKVALNYAPPAGPLGAIVAKLFGEEPEIQVEQELIRFKSLMEAGEIPTVEGQPRGK